MKTISQNSTLTFEPVEISENAKVNFTRVVNAKGVTIYGKIEKEGAEVGSISVDGSGNYEIVSFKPADRLTSEEKAAVYENVTGWIEEVTNA